MKYPLNIKTNDCHTEREVPPNIEISTEHKNKRLSQREREREREREVPPNIEISTEQIKTNVYHNLQAL